MGEVTRSWKCRKRDDRQSSWESAMCCGCSLCVINNTSLTTTVLFFMLHISVLSFLPAYHFTLSSWVSSCFIALFSSSVFLLSHPVEWMKDYRGVGWQWTCCRGILVRSDWGYQVLAGKPANSFTGKHLLTDLDRRCFKTSNQYLPRSFGTWEKISYSQNWEVWVAEVWQNIILADQSWRRLNSLPRQLY